MLRQADGQAISTLGFSADGQFIAVGGQSGEVLVWNIQAIEPVLALAQSHPGAWIDQLAWHPSRAIMAYGVGCQGQIWDVQQDHQVAELDFVSSSVLHLAWHPQGTWLAASGHGGIKVWSQDDWSSPPRLVAVPGASLHCAWSADGRYLGSGNLDRTLTVTEWASPPPWLMQGFPGKVRQVAWSEPNTQSGSPVVAAACAEGVTVWERDNRPGGGWKSRVLEYHRGRVTTISFQPRSLRLASAGQDRTIALWDNGKILSQTLKLPHGSCSALAWHPTGTLLAGATTEGELILWQQQKNVKGFS
jgi:WD40 repeat protein